MVGWVCGVCVLPGTHNLPIQPANSTDMRVYGLSSIHQQPHLKTWVATKAEWSPQIGPLMFSWCPLRDTKNCDVCYAGQLGVDLAAVHFQWCRLSTAKIVLMGTNRRQGSPVETDLKKMEWHSQDVSEVCKGIGTSWTLTGITTTQLNTFEGSRL